VQLELRELFLLHEDHSVSNRLPQLTLNLIIAVQLFFELLDTDFEESGLGERVDTHLTDGLALKSGQNVLKTHDVSNFVSDDLPTA